MNTNNSHSPIKQHTSSINDDLIMFIKSENVEGFFQYLKDLPVSTEFEIKPGYISFNIYKINNEHIEIHSTVNGWIMTTTTFELATLFFFGKIDSSFFYWI